MHLFGCVVVVVISVVMRAAVRYEGGGGVGQHNAQSLASSPPFDRLIDTRHIHIYFQRSHYMAITPESAGYSFALCATHTHTFFIGARGLASSVRSLYLMRKSSSNLIQYNAVFMYEEINGLWPPEEIRCGALFGPTHPPHFGRPCWALSVVLRSHVI